MYIAAKSCISYQKSFRNPGYSESLEPLESSELQHPNYSDFIQAMERRRMSDIQKMAMTCVLDCLSQYSNKEPEAIIFGSGLGSSQHTLKFMNKMLESAGGIISPTSFTVSTHNTVTGQISIFLGNRNYNIYIKTKFGNKERIEITKELYESEYENVELTLKK